MRGLCLLETWSPKGASWLSFPAAAIHKDSALAAAGQLSILLYSAYHLSELSEPKSEESERTGILNFSSFTDPSVRSSGLSANDPRVTEEHHVLVEEDLATTSSMELLAPSGSNLKKWTHDWKPPIQNHDNHEIISNPTLNQFQSKVKHDFKSARKLPPSARWQWCTSPPKYTRPLHVWSTLPMDHMATCLNQK